MQLKSSMVSDAEWDEKTTTLQLTFRNGQVWRYKNFQRVDWVEFLGATSAGVWIALHLTTPEGKVRWPGEEVMDAPKLGGHDVILSGSFSIKLEGEGLKSKTVVEAIAIRRLTEAVEALNGGQVLNLKVVKVHER